MKQIVQLNRFIQCRLLIPCLFGMLALSGCATTAIDDSSDYVAYDGVSQVEALLEFRDQNALEELCWDLPCREDFDLLVRFEDGTLDTRLPLYWPQIQKETVSVMPNETLYVELVESGDFLVPIAVHKQQDEYKSYMRVRMSQGESGTGTMITLSNPFEQTLKIHAHVVDASGQVFPIRSCSVVPSSSSYNSMPHPITEYFITHIRLLPMNAIFCAY
ncbi:hypothetical protein [Aliidiomarina indica]|uniref:hypothetical protein n=1 Tax=Aliidiomarina indica TaxID=2749147 RepID=UPI00188F7341|nr:hypothetical protein [Aliidiomarina indica]